MLEYQLTEDPSVILSISDNHVRENDSFEIYKIKYKDLVLIKNKYFKGQSIHVMRNALIDYVVKDEYVYLVDEKIIKKINQIKAKNL